MNSFLSFDDIEYLRCLNNDNTTTSF